MTASQLARFGEKIHFAYSPGRDLWTNQLKCGSMLIGTYYRRHALKTCVLHHYCAHSMIMRRAWDGNTHETHHYLLCLSPFFKTPPNLWLIVKEISLFLRLSFLQWLHSAWRYTEHSLYYHANWEIGSEIRSWPFPLTKMRKMCSRYITRLSGGMRHVGECEPNAQGEQSITQNLTCW